jgi:hypothetical protein
MRFAYSAFSATIGLLLLGIAIFDRPEVYLHDAAQRLRLLWDDGSGSDPDRTGGQWSVPWDSRVFKSQRAAAAPFHEGYEAVEAAARATMSQSAEPVAFPDPKPAIPEVPSAVATNRAPASEPVAWAMTTISAQPAPTGGLSAPSTIISWSSSPTGRPLQQVPRRRSAAATPRDGRSLLARIRQWSRELTRTAAWQPPHQRLPYRLAPNGLAGGGG